MRWSAIIAVRNVAQQAGPGRQRATARCGVLAFEFAVRAALFDALAQRAGRLSMAHNPPEALCQTQHGEGLHRRVPGAGCRCKG
jgi:hypothetical protein